MFRKPQADVFVCIYYFRKNVSFYVVSADSPRAVASRIGGKGLVGKIAGGGSTKLATFVAKSLGDGA